MALDSAQTAETRCHSLKRRYEGLKHATERTNCESHWQDIGEVISPRKIDFVGMRTPGEKRMNKVYDPTGILASEMLAAGLHGMATNPASKWFSLRLVQNRVQTPDGKFVNVNEAKPVQTYLADVEEIMWSRIYQPGTNFTTAIHEFYLDLGSFGTAIMFVGQRDDGGLLFETRSLAECVIAENSEGRVDTVIRTTTYTVRQMMQMAKTKDNPDGWTVSDHVKDMYREEKYDEPVKVIHAVYPRERREYGKKNPDNMPWASCYFEYDACHELEMGGFPEFPYLVGRWSKYASEIYGRSPGMTALPDVKMLQQMTLALVMLIQKAGNPPMWLRDDGILGQTRTVPGGINYWRGNPNEGVMLQPVSMQGIQYLVEYISGIKQQILQVFYADRMRMSDRAGMTATEVVQRTAEQMRLLGPLEGRLQSEVLGPLVERLFGIFGRIGVLPPAPQEIQEQEFTIEFVSPLATAQKQQSMSGLVQAAQVLANMIGPEGTAMVMQKRLDLDTVVEKLWDTFNNDPDMLKDEDAMEAAAQETQTAKALQVAQPAADAASKGARAVKDLAMGAAAGDGVDVQQLIGQFSQNVQDNPQAQQELQSLVNGQIPQ